MNFIDAVQTCFRKYANFHDRASLEELAGWMLFAALGYSLVLAIANFVPAASMVGQLYVVAMLLPTLAVAVRRRNDVRLSAYWRARLAIHIYPKSYSFA